MRGKEKQKRVEKRVRHMQKNIPLDFLDYVICSGRNLTARYFCSS